MMMLESLSCAKSLVVAVGGAIRPNMLVLALRHDVVVGIVVTRTAKAPFVNVRIFGARTAQAPFVRVGVG